MKDLRPGDPCLIRRAEHHPDPVYLSGQRSSELHRVPVRVRWSGYYRDLEREGALEVVSEEAAQAAAAALAEQIGEADGKELDALCRAVEDKAEAVAAILDQHGVQLQAATCRAAATVQVAAMRSHWGQLQAPQDGPGPQ